MTYNADVPNGKANGTRAQVKRLVLKAGSEWKNVQLDVDGIGTISVRGVSAEQVSHIVLQHCNTNIEPQKFMLEPKDFSFTALMPIPDLLQGESIQRNKSGMKGYQLPIVSNTATTGHKLQGSSMDVLFVHEWNYTTNWPYVVLSRVRTMEGLWFREPLKNDLKKYSLPEEYVSYRAKLLKKLVERLSDEQRQDLLNS